MDSDDFVGDIATHYAGYLRSTETLRAFLKEAGASLAGTVETIRLIEAKLEAARSGTPAPEEPVPAQPTVEIELTDDEVNLLHEVVGWRGTLLAGAQPMLIEMSEIYAVAMFDALVVDLFRRCLTHRPVALATRQKALDYESIVHAGSLEELQARLIDGEVDAFAFAPAAKQARRFDEMLGVSLGAAQLIQAVGVVRERRNLYAHNGGVMHQAYIDATGETHRVVGQRLALTLDEQGADRQVLDRAAAALVEGIRIQFCPEVAAGDLLSHSRMPVPFRRSR